MTAKIISLLYLIIFFIFVQSSVYGAPQSSELYILQDMHNGTIHYFFYESENISWQRNSAGKRIGICQRGICKSFSDLLSKKCSNIIIDGGSSQFVRVVCTSATAEQRAPANREGQKPNQQNDNLATDSAEHASFNKNELLEKAPERSNRELFLTILKDIWSRYDIRDCIKKLSNLPISKEWRVKACAAFLIVGIAIYILLILFEIIDLFLNHFLDVGASKIFSFLNAHHNNLKKIFFKLKI